MVDSTFLRGCDIDSTFDIMPKVHSVSELVRHAVRNQMMVLESYDSASFY
jgi:hypothetical protein